ncbi:AraC family transcriptional regulator [Paenibacillus sp. HN-1]|uniref:AraC family transcriptional regulator n=1 Tax=Paenibacillus TaxID=44249 RepID=UPI001CA857A0|nr:MULTISPECIES: AraC family transcriptional regulator [Paenibacillus]MBY9081405.1 AraC family transcriptional regulator [Paenibacillus sp. CGMCC 1.18879]MBY9084925.1 AraC family transcriptional regulator [Paenibacillus sinensis]
MTTNDMRSRGNLYAKLLMTITSCISLTLLITTILYYTYYTRIEKTDAFRADLDNLTQTSREVIGLTENAQSLSFQLYRNSTISKLLFYNEPNIYDVTAAMSELNNYLSSIPYIDSIYVYNPKNAVYYVASRDNQNGVIAEQELTDKGIVNLLTNYEMIKPFTPIPRTYLGGVDGKTETSVYSFLCFDAVNWNRTLNSAVVVNISASWINREFAGPKSRGVTYLLDDQARFLSGTTLKAESLTPEERRWIDKRISGSAESYFVGSFRGRSSLISYTSPDTLGWQYVRITPYSWITRQTVTIRNMTLLISALILLAGLLVSRMLSKRLYMPIGRIVDEINVLATEKRDNMYALRQNALRELVLESKPSEAACRPEKLRHLGVGLDLNEPCRLVLLRIDRFRELKETRGLSVRPYKFAIMNIASEIAGTDGRIETVDLNDDSVLLLINEPLEGSSDNPDGEMESLLTQIRQACLEYLKISITSAYSPAGSGVTHLNQQYKDICEASQHRLFEGPGSVISSARMMEQHQKDFAYTYPSELEKKLVEALAGGKAAEAGQYFSDILEGTRDFSFRVIQLAASRLTVTVKSAIDNIRRSGLLPLEEIQPLPSLSDCETAGELSDAYLRLFEEIGGQLADKRSSKQHELVRQINSKINASFMDPNLSLNQIADELGMSPIYISRVYKQQTLSAIMDVVMEKRMQEVERLLKDTDYSVSAIAEQTGFTSSSYLHRMFKRHFSVTPIEYRKSAK